MGHEPAQPGCRWPEDEGQEDGHSGRQQDFLADVQGCYRRRAEERERDCADQMRLRRGGVRIVEQLHGALSDVILPERQSRGRPAASTATTEDQYDESNQQERAHRGLPGLSAVAV